MALPDAAFKESLIGLLTQARTQVENMTTTEDLTAQIAQLTSQLAEMTAARDLLLTQNAALQVKIDSAIIHLNAAATALEG